MNPPPQRPDEDDAPRLLRGIAYALAIQLLAAAAVAAAAITLSAVL